MKKIVLLSFIALSGTIAFAQNGFYLAPEIGDGVSSSYSQPFPNGNNPDGRVSSQQYQLKAGYSFHNWQLETGIGYLTTGVQRTGYEVFFFNSFYNGGVTSAYEPPKYKYETINHHITLPLCLSYKINMGKKFSLSPRLGEELFYNTSTEIKNSGDIFRTPGNSYYHYNTVSRTLLFSLEAGYKLNSKWSIIAGPSMQCMLTQMTVNSGYDYAYLFNAGVKYYLQKKKAK